jgi:hypothetical protein
MPINRDDNGLYSPGLWDDFSIPATRLRQGALQKPDFDYTNIGLLFPQNDATEIIYTVAQMPHARQYGTDLKLHVHYIQSSVVKPTFECEYRFYNNGDTVPGSWTSLSTADGNKGVFDYTSGSILQIGTFSAISPVGDGISANLEFKLWRNDNDVTGDVLVKYIDFHYFRDSSGSRGEFVK